MESRILNAQSLASHGNIAGRKAILEILEAGLKAVDPYNNTKKLVRLKGNSLIIGGEDFEPQGSPKSGNEVIDLSKIGKIYVIGAGKGIQRIAKAIEDTLGDRLAGGHVIDKKGHPIILERIGVTLGGHPVPDVDCVKGCRKVLDITENLTENDLVFTCASNGISSLLTMPLPGVNLADIQKITHIMQIERGAPTKDLNPIRSHLDMLKGGRISKYILPAKAIHILAIEPGNYEQLIYWNPWLHTLPDYTTFKDAVSCLKKWDAWNYIPASVKDCLLRANPDYETVKAEEFQKMPSRIFGVMPGFRQTAKLDPAMRKAEELGLKTVVLTDLLFMVEAQNAATFFTAICKTIERTGSPFKPPCALFSSGEMLVTVGRENGIGGRNQEFSLAAALRINGSENIVVASVDTDGTDGPGTQLTKRLHDMPHCLAGGIADGKTVTEAQELGIDIEEEIKRHNTSPPLWKLKSGIIATPNISLVDLTVALVLGCSEKASQYYY